ncbi:MAG TPA: hypothetical protein VGD56_20345, partial [Gemmatirosa sp.]
MPAAVFAVGSALWMPVQPASAQTMRGVLRDVGRQLGRPTGGDTTSRRTRDAAGGAPASGGALQIVEQHVEGSDSLARAFDITPADTGVTLG